MDISELPDFDIEDAERCEEQVKLEVITPALESAGWPKKQLRMEFITAGRMLLDRDRASMQVNGQRRKSVRYALLKNPENLRPEEAEELMDITRDNELIGTSYQMKESLRQVFDYTADEIDLAREHLTRWVQWASEKGSSGFKALARTVNARMEGILRAIQTGVNNGYQESLNGRVQLSKRLARGYGKEMRLARMVFFRDSCRSL